MSSAFSSSRAGEFLILLDQNFFSWYEKNYQATGNPNPADYPTLELSPKLGIPNSSLYLLDRFVRMREFSSRNPDLLDHIGICLGYAANIAHEEKDDDIALSYYHFYKPADIALLIAFRDDYENSDISPMVDVLQAAYTYACKED